MTTVYSVDNKEDDFVSNLKEELIASDYGNNTDLHIVFEGYLHNKSGFKLRVENIEVFDANLLENWTECDRQKVQSIIKSFLSALINSNTPVNDALDWISVLNMPQRVEIKLLQDVNKFYNCKDFLKRMNAEWLMDTLFE